MKTITPLYGLAAIKEAVESGKTVCADSPAYNVIKDSLGQFLIKYIYSDYCIGLTWRDGVTLNAKRFWIE